MAAYLHAKVTNRFWFLAVISGLHGTGIKVEEHRASPGHSVPLTCG